MMILTWFSAKGAILSDLTHAINEISRIYIEIIDRILRKQIWHAINLLLATEITESKNREEHD